MFTALRKELVYGSLLVGLAGAITACAAIADQDEICIGRKGTHCRLQSDIGNPLPKQEPPVSTNNGVAVEPGS